MGIYISLRILDIPDLTTEGSFGFGAVISVLVALAGHPILALCRNDSGRFCRSNNRIFTDKIKGTSCFGRDYYNEWAVFN